MFPGEPPAAAALSGADRARMSRAELAAARDALPAALRAQTRVPGLGFNKTAPGLPRSATSDPAKREMCLMSHPPQRDAQSGRPPFIFYQEGNS